MKNNLFLILLVAIALYVYSTNTGNASTTTAAPAGNCLQSIQAQYSAQWAEMNQVQRAIVGLRAASCEGGK